MRTVAFIHAKHESKRLPGKHMMLVGDKPIIQYSMEAAENAEVDDVVVSSDDPDILDLAGQFGFQREIREPEYAGDQHTGYETIQRSVDRYPHKDDHTVWVALMGATLLFRDGIVDEVIAGITERSARRSICVVKEAHRYPQYCFERDDESGMLKPYGGVDEDIRPSVQHRDPWYVDGIVYAWRDTIQAHQPVYGVPIERWEYVHVHDKFDMEMAAWLLARSRTKQEVAV